MRYAVIINLDYEGKSNEHCRQVWRLIRQFMVDFGFRSEGRLFTIESPEQDVCDLARQAMDAIGQHDFFQADDFFGYLKEFYCYNHSGSINLLLPPSEGFELEEG